MLTKIKKRTEPKAISLDEYIELLLAAHERIMSRVVDLRDMVDRFYAAIELDDRDLIEEISQEIEREVQIGRTIQTEYLEELTFNA